MSETLRKLTRTSVKVGVLGAGILMIGSSAHADWSTGFNSGAAAGNQTFDGVQAPVNTCGTAVGAEGDANAFCVGGSSATFDISSFQNWYSGFNSGAASGLQSFVLTQAPVNTCGTAVAGLGDVNAACVGGSSATVGVDDDDDQVWGQSNTAAANKATVKKAHARKGRESAGPEVFGLDGLTNMLPMGGMAGGLGGNQRLAAPAASAKDDWGYGDSQSTKSARYGWGDTDETCDFNLSTGFNGGAASGVQTFAPVLSPIDTSGTAVGGVGDANAFSVGGASSTFC